MQSNLKWFSKPQIQSLIAFSISTCIHLAICITLALILISGQGSVGNALQLSNASVDPSEDVTQLDVTMDLNPVQPDVPADSKLKLSTISTELSLPLEPVVSSIRGGDSSGKVAAQVAEAASAGGADEVVAHQSKSRASFFGAHADGNRFVFVIDSSGSMRGPRWEALCKELIRAIRSLSPDQDFFVISFDFTAHPMFGIAPPKGTFLKAVEKNVDRIQNWLRSIRHGSQTFPASAVGIAMKLEPDAIFLLSDGEISDSTVEDLRVWNRQKNEDDIKAIIPIHTVLLHSQIGYATLETIARENGGTFTPVQAR